MNSRNAPGKLSKAGFAATFGVSEHQLERLFQQGMPHGKKGRRIEIPMPEGRVWYHDYLVQKGRKQAAPTSLDEARKRREFAQTEMAELDLAERQGVTMLVVDGERWLAEAFARVRARLQNFAPRVAGIVIGAATVQEAQARIDPLVREVMEELRAGDDVPVTEDDAEEETAA